MVFQHEASDAVIKAYRGNLFLENVWKKVRRKPPQNAKKCLRAQASEIVLSYAPSAALERDQRVERLECDSACFKALRMAVRS